MDRIDPVFLEMMGDVSSVGELPKVMGRSLSICSCVQGMGGKIVDYAQVFVNKKGVLSTSVEGLIDSGDAIAPETGFRMGLNLKPGLPFESPEVIFGKTHDALVSGCVVGFDLANTFFEPYAKTYETFTGRSLLMVPLTILDVRVAAVGLGLLKQEENSLLMASKKFGFRLMVGDRAWSKALLVLFLLNKLVELFGAVEVMKYAVGSGFPKVDAGPTSSGEHDVSSGEGYKLTTKDDEGFAASDVAEGSAESTGSDNTDSSAAQLVVKDPSFVEANDAVVSGKTDGEKERALPAVGADDATGEVERRRNRPDDLVAYSFSIIESKRVRSYGDGGILKQVERCLIDDGFDPEECIYDVQNIILSGIRDGSIDPFSLVDQVKVECVQKTIGHKKNMMIKAIMIALKKNGVFLDPIEVAACLRLGEERIE